MADKAVELRLYALVDLARAPHLAGQVGALDASAAQCLFEGAIPVALRRVSPVIVDLARAPWLLEMWLGAGRGQSWGVFMETWRPLGLARRHVRRFLQVRLPDGAGPVLMRFWDPRVLGPLLELAEAEQIARLFDGIVSYAIETGPKLERVTMRSGAIARQEIEWGVLAAVVSARSQPRGASEFAVPGSVRQEGVHTARR